MEYVGIDLHKKESQICLLTETGEVIERRIRTEPQRFAEVLGGRPRARILVEASTESEWVARCLEALGHEVVVADPNFAPMYATRTRKVKTDRRDARALQEACLLGAYRPAHRLSDAQRHVRGRLAVRDALVRTRTGYIALTRALLRRHGWRVATGSADTFSRRVMALPLPGRLLSEVAPLLAVMRTVNQQLAYSDGVIEAVTRPDARVQRLRTVPCVGPVTAAAFVATIDDAGRFHRAHEVAAYLGLVPRELSSGESQRRGRITKAGNRRMRWLLVQAAVSILRLRDPRTAALRRWATGIAAPREEDRRRRAGPPLGGPPLCDAARRDDVYAAGWAPRSRGSRSGSEGRRVAHAQMADLGNTRIAPQADGRNPGSPGRSIVCSAMSGTLVSRRFDGWVSAYVDVAAVRAPVHRWRPHPSTPLMRRRAPLAPDERE
jgi:transposase